MKLVIQKEDATVAVTSKETNVTNVMQNIGDSQPVMVRLFKDSFLI